MKVFVTKELGIVIAIVSLATVWNLGIATAQTAEEGIANFYSDKFQGKKTASGAVYDKNKLTASHKTLPYGTKVRVTNLDNGKSVVVAVNDRMKPGNPAVIDVTRRAAQDLGFTKAGKAKVKLEDGEIRNRPRSSKLSDTKFIPLETQSSREPAGRISARCRLTRPPCPLA
jgi:peptidoglycan lytic transglycosylase